MSERYSQQDISCTVALHHPTAPQLITCETNGYFGAHFRIADKPGTSGNPLQFAGRPNERTTYNRGFALAFLVYCGLSSLKNMVACF